MYDSNYEYIRENYKYMTETPSLEGSRNSGMYIDKAKIKK